ncbi:SDR family oxidoreductase [Phycicoccus sp. CSK15P-2]|uniref:SDR family NAD(P)-dependent oxidoreductase n=1 Tax=Phycicoccus sp. CSK15P-2 TaxID=2807627 RepID=UPI0019526092|nr:SDR family oxidoreductase [Phycicoccus sp. CSK15P-2]MBM6403089.1 SDR family oxidoreductase [Phycicoccus sp. CSK15P-2]
MDVRLDGKRAFVSGSTQGIGFAVARAMLASGAAVTVNGRSRARVEEAVERLRVAVPDGEVSGVAADVADPKSVDALMRGLGPVDILVNNVGMFGVAPFGDVTDDEWQAYFDVNVMSGVRLSRHVLDAMLGAGWGRVVFVASESGVDVPGDMIPYGASKAAMLAVANGLAKLTRGTQVTVNSILGGPTYSDGVAAVVSGIAAAQDVPEEELKQGIIAGRGTSLLQRFIEPDEIADLVVYLSSPRSSATNGAALRADGGVLTTLL